MIFYTFILKKMNGVWLVASQKLQVRVCVFEDIWPQYFYNPDKLVPSINYTLCLTQTDWRRLHVLCKDEDSLTLTLVNKLFVCTLTLSATCSLSGRFCSQRRWGTSSLRKNPPPVAWEAPRSCHRVPRPWRTLPRAVTVCPRSLVSVCGALPSLIRTSGSPPTHAHNGPFSTIAEVKGGKRLDSTRDIYPFVILKL